MRHGRTAALPFGEWFLRLANFGTLQVPDFQRDFFECRRDERKRTEILRMTVALNHLGSDWSGCETKPLTNSLFHFRPQVRSIADRARNLSQRHLRGRVAEARNISLVLREPVRNLQSEGDRFCVDPVCPSDLRSVAEFVRAKIENLSKHH
jgi:hypothetical protein